MTPDSTPQLLPATVPLFPLPNLVLFPRAVLPLHIFEERYKQMVADALAGPKLIAMALLCPGWNVDYHATPPIHPIVCVGQILTHVSLPDGGYNMILQGCLRAAIITEKHHGPYRVAKLQELTDQVGLQQDLTEEHQILEDLAARTGLEGYPGISTEGASGRVPVGTLADLLAFHCLDDIATKQSLLAEQDVATRVRRTIAAVAEIGPRFVWRPRAGQGKPSFN